MQAPPWKAEQHASSLACGDWSVEATACMDYLHGCVADEEIEPVCRYEYGRESELLRYAARRFHEATAKKARTKRRGLDSADVAHELRQWDVDVPLMQWPWVLIWRSGGFPAKPWTALNREEKATILRVLPKGSIGPLATIDVLTHEANGVFDEFKALAATAETELGKRMLDPSCPPAPPALIAREQWVHALFTLDFTKTKKRLAQEFEAWLSLPENQRRFERHSKDQTGSTGTCKDRLKNLAVKRLHEQLGFDEMLRFTQTHRKRTPDGKPMAFHDARKGQSSRDSREEAPLCSEESYCHKAIQRVREHLTKLFPWEYQERKPIPNDPRPRFLAGLKQISKRNS